MKWQGITREIRSGIHQPEYTGTNRCTLCTILNTILAGVVSVILSATTYLISQAEWLSVMLGTSALFILIMLIYYRGYIVPKTPKLTKQYLPPAVLLLFGKSSRNSTPSSDVVLDAETTLRDAGVLIPDAGGGLEISPSFERKLVQDGIECRDSYSTMLSKINNVFYDGAIQSSKSLDIDAQEESHLVYLEGELIGRWVSRVALLLDLKAGELLQAHCNEWAHFSPKYRGQLLSSLRLFVKSCPNCDEDLEVENQTVESCCQTFNVFVMDCPLCASRVYESQPINYGI